MVCCLKRWPCHSHKDLERNSWQDFYLILPFLPYSHFMLLLWLKNNYCLGDLKNKSIIVLHFGLNIFGKKQYYIPLIISYFKNLFMKDVIILTLQIFFVNFFFIIVWLASLGMESFLTKWTNLLLPWEQFLEFLSLQRQLSSSLSAWKCTRTFLKASEIMQLNHVYLETKNFEILAFSIYIFSEFLEDI